LPAQSAPLRGSGAAVGSGLQLQLAERARSAIMPALTREDCNLTFR
jgi:hypothetical protein